MYQMIDSLVLMLGGCNPEVPHRDFYTDMNPYQQYPQHQYNQSLV